MNDVGNRVHFIGICGAGMSAVAKMMRDKGWQVSGSDEGFYPPVSLFLEREGLPCQHPHAPENIPPDTSLIVIGKHAKLTPETNAEVRRAFEMREAGQAQIASYPEVLRGFTQNTKNIVVVGSYGKSTTTTLLAWALADAGQDPSFFIGAIPLDFDTNGRLGSGDYFVLEGDEYPAANWDDTPKFRFYNPHTVLLTSCEHDHFNAFKTEEDYLAPYLALVADIPPDGLLVACLDGKGVERAIAAAKCRVVTYSADPNSNADWVLAEAHWDENPIRFVVQQRESGKVLTEKAFTTWLLGEHNLQNSLGCVATLRALGVLSFDEIERALATARGLRRRLEAKGDACQIPIFEDLSSSRPKAVAALSAIRQHRPNARIFAVFQPHTFSFRSRKALEWYPGMFADADTVLVFSPPNLRGMATSETLSHDEILGSIAEGNEGCTVHPVRDAEEILEALLPQITPQDALLFMTSGGMEDAIEPVIARLESTFPRETGA